jgi:hypothetical protein
MSFFGKSGCRIGSTTGVRAFATQLRWCGVARARESAAGKRTA